MIVRCIRRYTLEHCVLYIWILGMKNVGLQLLVNVKFVQR